MPRQQAPPTALFAISAAIMVFIGSLLSVGILIFIPFIMQLIVAVLLALSTYLVIIRANRIKLSRTSQHWEKMASATIMILLAVSSVSAIKAINIGPFDPVANRFVFENIAVVALILGIVVMLILNGLQRGLYWPLGNFGNPSKAEQASRQKILEKFGRYSIFLVALTVGGYVSTASNIPNIIRLHQIGTTVPGHYFIPAYSLVVALFALPMYLAARQK